jgi:hypothetical protein
MLSGMEMSIANQEAQGLKLLSITISLMKEPIRRPDKKLGHRSIKPRRVAKKATGGRGHLQPKPREKRQ